MINSSTSNKLKTYIALCLKFVNAFSDARIAWYLLQVKLIYENSSVESLQLSQFHHAKSLQDKDFQAEKRPPKCQNE